METKRPTPVAIVDIKMPFWSMVTFMVKAAFAAIPAIIITAILFTVLMAFFGSFIR